MSTLRETEVEQRRQGQMQAGLRAEGQETYCVHDLYVVKDDKQALSPAQFHTYVWEQVSEQEQPFYSDQAVVFKNTLVDGQIVTTIFDIVEYSAGIWQDVEAAMDAEERGIELERRAYHGALL
jgi:hypothetical protein